MLVDLCDCCDVDFLFIFIENDPGYCPRLSQVKFKKCPDFRYDFLMFLG